MTRANRIAMPIVGLLLLLLVSAVYVQTAWFDWLRYDDPQYVTENPSINQGLSIAGLREAFTHGLNLLWIPVTSLSYMAGVSIHGLHPAGHHLTNVVIHGINVLLALVLFMRLTRSAVAAAVATALFSVHPLGVESVAWISGRKDLLCAFFWLATILAYQRYSENPRPMRLLLPTLLFGLGMASKVTMLSLPVILLVMDWHPFERMRKGRYLPRCLAMLSLEKLPMFLIGGAVAWWAVQLHVTEGGIRSLDQVPFAIRIMNAIYVHALYVAKFAVPSGLTVHYPYLEVGPEGIWLAASLLLLTAITLAALLLWRRLPLLLVGWLWYLIAMLPSSGLVRVDSFLTADRYAYVPMLGLSLMVGVGIAELIKQSARWRVPLLFVVGTAVLLLAFAAFVQAGHWRNDVTLFGRAARLYPDSPTILNGYGTALNRAGQREEARAIFLHAREAGGPFRILPTMNLAMLHAADGDWTGARDFLVEVAGGNPSYRPAYELLARVLRDQAAATGNPQIRGLIETEASYAEAQAYCVAHAELLDGPGMPNDLPHPAPVMAEAARRIAKAYVGINLPDESSRYQRIADELATPTEASTAIQAQ